jgi:hypothetical protein
MSVRRIAVVEAVSARQKPTAMRLFGKQRSRDMSTTATNRKNF